MLNKIDLKDIKHFPEGTEIYPDITIAHVDTQHNEAICFDLLVCGDDRRLYRIVDTASIFHNKNPEWDPATYRADAGDKKQSAFMETGGFCVDDIPEFLIGSLGRHLHGSTDWFKKVSLV